MSPPSRQKHHCCTQPTPKSSFCHIPRSKYYMVSILWSQSVVASLLPIDSLVEYWMNWLTPLLRVESKTLDLITQYGVQSDWTLHRPGHAAQMAHKRITEISCRFLYLHFYFDKQSGHNCEYVPKVRFAFDMNSKVGAQVPPQKLRHFLKNIRWWVDDECCCPRISDIYRVNFTNKNVTYVVDKISSLSS